MKKRRLTFTKSDDRFTCRYTLEVNDIVDTKAFDLGLSGKLPQIIPCKLTEEDGERIFVYEIENKLSLTELLKREINKKQMLMLLYNILSSLEKFGANMVSLSYVAKDVQYIFVNPDTMDTYFIVAAVDKEMSDLNEVRSLIKNIIVDATYSEIDGDNYVAKLITYANKAGTFSISDMGKYIENMLREMNVFVDEGKKPIDMNNVSGGKVSRVAVMQNNARMNQQAYAPMQGGPMQGGPMPNGQPMPMQGRPIPNEQPIPEVEPKSEPEQIPTPEQMPKPIPVPTPQEKPVSEKPVSEQPAEPMPYLIRVKNNEKIYIDKPEFTIGKSATNADYTISDNTAVSRIHCIINRKNGVSYIKDNNSTNGTFLNGKDIKGEENVFLTNRAKLVLGDEEFIYYVR